MFCNTIHKFFAPIDDSLSIMMPRGAEILSVQVQHAQPQIWAAVDTNQPPQQRRFCWRGTGHDVTGLSIKGFIGTVQMQNSSLVFHLFEVL